MHFWSWALEFIHFYIYNFFNLFKFCDGVVNKKCKWKETRKKLEKIDKLHAAAAASEYTIPIVCCFLIRGLFIHSVYKKILIFCCFI